jgi:predicted ATPase
MPINKLSIANFKGVAALSAFDIRPITIFLGANSSGKSSCIHALVSLSQTLKLGNSAPALVLDDDFAHVHLGRFVEIAHSHTYADPITLGIEIGKRTFDLGFKKGSDVTQISGTVQAEYQFRSTLRTQEVYVDTARISIGERAFQIKRGTKSPYKFSTLDELGKRRFETERTGNFLFRLQPTKQNLKADDGREWFENYWLTEVLQKEVERELRETRYLGPFRQSPLRRYPFRGATATEVGSQGEAAITLLASEHVQSQDRVHAKQINRWLAALGLAKSVELSRVGTSDLFDVSLKLADGNKLPTADLGYGLSQVLPVLTQCSFASKGSTLLFEQPELHLHEDAAKKLAYVFHETASEREARVVIETHSKELVYEVLALIKAGSLKTEDLAIYKVQRLDGASNYKRLTVEWDGEYLEVDDPWVKALTGQ